VTLVNPIVDRWVQDARRDPEAFWAKAASALPWFRTWDKVFDWTPPTFKWFVGAQTNLSYNAVDRHVEAGDGGRAALVYLNERGERRVLTYAQLRH
jgi:acetyl-CoA synthetase